MAGMELPESLPRPFANYDVVVYFGGGLFFVPFVNRYFIEPFHAKFPSFEVPIGTQIGAEAVSILALLFTVYIIGHLLAYLSSQVVEKTVDRVFGKISSAILISTASNANNRNQAIRALIYDQMRRIKEQRALFSSIIRMAFHIPLLPSYILVYFVGVFGYYDCRVSNDIMQKAKDLYSTRISASTPINIRTPWFKPLEYYVINRMPSAVARMYNYLIISGLFRTLTFIFILADWALLYYMAHNLIDGHWWLKPYFGLGGNVSVLFEYANLTLLATFSLFSYIKFQRRYAEEAIFAFVFAKEA